MHTNIVVKITNLVTFSREKAKQKYNLDDFLRNAWESCHVATINSWYIHDSTYYFFVSYFHNAEELCYYFEMDQYLLTSIW